MNRKSIVLAMFIGLVGGCTHTSTDEALPTPMSLGGPATGVSAGSTATPATATASGGFNPAAGNHPPVVDSIEITGSGNGEIHPNAKDTLHAAVKFHDPDGDLTTLKVRWLEAGKEIGIGESLPPGPFKVGDFVTAEAQATDVHGSNSQKQTQTVQITSTPPQFTTQPSGNLNGYHPVAVDADGAPLPVQLSGSLPGFSFVSGTLVFDSAAGHAASGHQLSFTARDKLGAQTSQTVTVNF